MATFGRTRSTIDGADALVRDFNREADQIRPRAEDVVVEYADQAAERMRDTVPVYRGDVKSSITADERASQAGTAVYADAGPDTRAHKGAFVARFLEHGTVKMAPRPFVGPTADSILGDFARAIRDLSKL